MTVGTRVVTVSKLDAMRRYIERSTPGASIVRETSEETGDLGSYDYRQIIEEFTDDYAVELDDLGKMLVMSSAGSKKFTLPSVTADDMGLPITFVKRGAGKLTIEAAGGETINDSSGGGTLYNDLAEETFAIAMLKVIAAETWIIEFFTGSGWRTS